AIEKHPRAREWVVHLWETSRGRISFQVLNEYYTVVTRKLKPGLSREEARSDVRNLFAWLPQLVNGDAVEAAWGIEDRFGLPFWDALIVSAAQVAGCGYLLTENLQNGQEVDGVRVLSPFVVRPSEVG
ncbi:MAG TPA: PIN domain-containing protein, partial [Candidatus Dormibacteraeota bacterium]